MQNFQSSAWSKSHSRSLRSRITLHSLTSNSATNSSSQCGRANASKLGCRDSKGDEGGGGGGGVPGLEGVGGENSSNGNGSMSSESESGQSDCMGMGASDPTLNVGA
jgi:hypothetical protein